ncbi:E3 ubiquitin-protein ligase MARCHF3-like [Oppia nitens]|uniref:E3 ubiquitin-protein ligase MARCHF3-like n=1 Tax=Oppia nitens TaxID=1686743 RepID=UPI0023DAAFF1|nr:E3 ubiquitin-protein ligase MARCHF3-like [Oppia nitens]
MSSPSLNNNNKCRVCMITSGELLTVCRCRSWSLAHKQCLKHYVKLTLNHCCDVCGHQYAIRRRPMNMVDMFANEPIQLETLVEIASKLLNLIHCWLIVRLVIALADNTDQWLQDFVVFIVYSRLAYIVYIFFRFVATIVWQYSRYWRPNNFVIDFVPMMATTDTIATESPTTR